MTYLVCRPCLTAFHVVDAAASDLFNEIAKEGLCCPRCAGQVTKVLRSEISDAAFHFLSQVDLTSEEMFRAQLGLGLPDEQECSSATVTELLRTQPLRRVVGHDVPSTHRMIVEYLELWDGTRLHFGSSSHGAVVYRITRPVNATQKVLNEQE